MEAKRPCRSWASEFFANADAIRRDVAEFVKAEGWDDYVLTRLSCSLPKGHSHDHIAHYYQDLDREELLRWPQERSPLDPFQGV